VLFRSVCEQINMILNNDFYLTRSSFSYVLFCVHLFSCNSFFFSHDVGNKGV